MISTETEARIPQELPLSLIESEILQRLPAKSIGSFKSVCKRWNWFLSTPTFGKMHFQYHGTTIDDHKLLLIDGSTIRKLPFTDTINPNPNPNPDPEETAVLASLDGLVLLASFIKTKRRRSTELVLWNPFTGAKRKLSYSIEDHRDVYLMFPTDAVGFYKDSRNHDYRVLYLECGGDHGAYIYSHRRDSWREIVFPFPFRSFRNGGFCTWSPATFLGQCLYFIVTAQYLTSETHSWIVCFDVETETFRKIQFPPVSDASEDCCGSLIVLNGHLHLCLTYFIKNELKQHGDLWRMDIGNGDGWVMVSSFSRCFRRQQDICTATTGNWVAVLDQENNSFRKLNTEDFTTHYPYFSFTNFQCRHSRIIYAETLVSPNP